MASKASREGAPQQLSEKELVADIVEHLATAIAQLPQEQGGDEETDTKGALVEEADIIGVAEAKRSTGLLEQWGHSLKKLVWA